MKTDACAGGEQRQSGVAGVQWSFRCFIALCALIDCWNARFQNNPDGVAYMDMGDLYWRGDWHAALNTYWSPLYGWLTGWMIRLTHPAIRWEYPEVHLLNFVIFLALLFCFEFFWRQLLAARGEEFWVGRTHPYVWVLGYLIFICIYLGSRELEHVSPDLLVAAWMFLVFGLMLRFFSGRAGTLDALLLGSTLGAGYLTKAVMLPFAFVVLPVLLAVVWKRRGGIGQFGMALLAFLVISAPLIAALSWNHHRFTTGDAGKLNLAWCVNGVNGSDVEYRLWQGDQAASAHRLHPVSKIVDWPEVYEFAAPVPGTYPVWYDPSYWWAGVDTHFHPLRTAVNFLRNTGHIVSHVIRELAPLAAVVLMIFLSSDRIRDSWRQLLRFWPILLPAAAIMLIYAMITFQPRHSTAIMAAGFGAVIVSASISDEQRRVKLLRAASLTLSVMVAGFVVQSIAQNHHDTGLWRQQVVTAERLRAMGLDPGSRVAIIGDGFDEDIWARLDRVTIVAELPHTSVTGDSASAFWNATPQVEQKVLHAMQDTGAKAVVAAAPPEILPPGWTSLDHTGHAVYFFR